MGKRVGFVSFRFAGTDGVSLEALKWAEVLEAHGFECYFLGGELDTPAERSMLVEKLHFQHPRIRKLHDACFSRGRRTRELTNELHRLRDRFKDVLEEFVRRFEIDLLLPQNAITIPLNLPFGMALTEFIAETGITTIAHHHDFFWERKRFLSNGVWDILNGCYPPHLPSITHVVINSSAQNQLALRTGIGATLIPNVMRFEEPPRPPDEYSDDVRAALGIDKDELLVLQPTRVVQRKGIEHAVELVARLGRKATLVISHASGDEGYEYQERVREYAELFGISTRFVDDIIGDKRGRTADGRKIYSLQDVYPYADLVTYPSLFEGFGNAFLETIYFRKPIVVNNYSIYSYDIKPKGFRVIEIDNFVSDDTIAKVKRVLDDDEYRRQMVDFNYALGCRYFSFHILENKLLYLVKALFGREEDAGACPDPDAP